MWREARQGLEKTVQIFAGTRRRKWITVMVCLWLFSCSIALSSVELYSASTTIFVDQEHVLALPNGEASATWLEDTLVALRHLILSEDFIEPHIVQKLSLRLEDVSLPPMRLKFMPKIVETMTAVSHIFTDMWSEKPVAWSAEQKDALTMRKVADSVKKNITLFQSNDMLLTISYTGPNPAACKKIIEIVTNQCKELLLRSRNQDIRDTLRLLERQYQEANQHVEELQQQLIDMRGEQFKETPENRVALLQQRQHALDELRILEAELQVFTGKKHDVMEKQNERRQHILEATPDMLTAYLSITKPLEMQHLDAKKMRLHFLEHVYPNHDEHREVQELKVEIALWEERLHLDVSDTETMRKKVLLADPIYTEYVRQLAEIETQEVVIRVKEARLRTSIALYEEDIEALAAKETHFHALQLKIELYQDLQYGFAKERNAARVNMQLMKTRSHWLRIIGRSYPENPMWGSPRDIVIMCWCLVVLFIILAFFLSRLFRYIKTFGINTH
jgi:hypothetical protein